MTKRNAVASTNDELSAVVDPPNDDRSESNEAIDLAPRDWTWCVQLEPVPGRAASARFLLTELA